MAYKNLSKAEKLKRYRQRLDFSKRWRQTEGYDELWRRLIDLYRGKHFSGLSDEDRIAVNVAFSTVNVIYPAISINHPHLTVNARKPEDEDAAHLVEAVVNYQWRHFKVKPEFRRAAKDFLILGHGWVKTGYRFVEGERELTDDERDAKFGEQLDQLDQYAEQNPHLADQLPTDEQVLASVPTSETVILEDRPFAERVSPFDIYVDPEATSMADLKWIAQRIVRPLEEVESDDRYSPSARNKIKPDSHINESWYDKSNERQYGDETKRVTVWEFYDLTCGEMSVFAETGDSFLVAPTKLPYAYGHPFTMIRNYDIPDFFYPMGDLEAIEPIQEELNKLRSMTMNHRKRYARKYLYKESAFDSVGRMALADDADNTMVPVTEDIPLNEAVAPMPQSPLPPEFYQFSEQAEADIDKVTGVNEYQRGSLPEIRRTATEASIIQDAANSRAADKLSVIEEAVAEVGAHLVALCQAFLSGDHVARIVGDNGHPLWVPYSRDEIAGEFDFEVEAGSTQPRNDTLRNKQALDMLQALAPFMAPGPAGPGIVNAAEVLKYVLQFGFDVKNPSKFLQVPQAPEVTPGAPPDPTAVPPGTVSAEPGADPNAVPGADAVPPDILAQLQGQVGYQPASA